MEDTQKQRYLAIASFGAMALFLTLAAKAYLWFYHTALYPPEPVSAELPASDPALAVWPQVARDLAEAKSLTVYSILPGSGETEPDPSPADDTRLFLGYPILGRAQVTSPERISRIAEELARGISFGDGFACFFPRHGVRAGLRDGRRIDLVICYSCARIEVYGARGEIQVQPGPSREVLDEALRAAGVDPNDPRLSLPWENRPSQSSPEHRGARRLHATIRPPQGTLKPAFTREKTWNGF